MRIFLFVVLSAGVGYGQKRVPLASCTVLGDHYADSESNRLYVIDGIHDVEIVTNVREREYFVPDDTLHRDCIAAGTKRYIIDSLLGLQQRDYTVLFDLMAVYKVETKSRFYLILEGADTFPPGTDQQVSYIVLEKKKDDWIFISSYHNGHNMPTDGIRVTTTRESIRLKGKYLKRIKGGSVI